MKLSEITSILAQASLPALSRDQLLELAGSGGGKRFEASLLAFAAGERKARDELEATVRVLDAKTRATLRRVGGQLPVDQLVAIACREQRRFFDSIDAIKTGSARAASARSYLVELGAASVPMAAAPTPAATPAVDPPYYSFKIFSSGAALCIAEATTQAERKHTINIEGAVALAGGTRKTFDWPNKIVVQLTVQEAYQVLALLENKIRSLRFDGHGRAHDKSLSIDFQDSHYFVRVTQRGRAAIALPVRPVDTIQIVALLYRQLLANEPHLQIADIRTLVARMASMTANQ
ncbi:MULTISPECIES: hypothetical protein [unclassified Massilia]|uniref:hypothetical protein n=1 Tax=unclassified Massilia TaxID=2609279 RepID=UPI0017821141|nr:MULTISPECIES: hypothetical protein [unclassified Massilia]MBD8531679.1 hypothetical protein [Massilia sp. CFBP 13647]MBD8675123.1 hypothetical protein [Massilia sp. CFBP 13721]